MKERFMSVNLFGIGNVKKMPGTVATIVVMPILYFFRRLLGVYYYTLILLILLPYAIRACERAFLERGDHPSIVLDEVVGAALIFSFMGRLTLFKAGIGFIVFRVLDILKPWPISIWQKEPLPIGVVADDMLAGLIAAIVAALF